MLVLFIAKLEQNFQGVIKYISMKKRLQLLSVLLSVLALSANGQTTYSYTGGVQTWTIPAGVFSISIDAQGGTGGSAYYSSAGGCGGRVQCNLAVTPGQVLNIYVGGAGGDGSGYSGGAGGNTGPFASGGAGGSAYYGTGAGGGGGATDLRIGGTALANRVLAAGGGGGGGNDCGIDNGGSGGGPGSAGNGLDCGSYSSFTCGGGATPASAGSGASFGGGTGGPLTGGIGTNPGYGFNAGGGGGGGYYGGGGGYYGGGGGGSSYTNPAVTSAVTHTAGYNCGGDGLLTITVLCTAPTGGSISGPAVMCSGSTSTFTDATGTAGGVWTSSNPAIASVVGATGLVTAGGTPGVATITYTIALACGTASATKSLTVNPLPNAGTITGPLEVCHTSTTSLTDAAPGGTWSSVTMSVATVNSSGVVTAITPGTTEILYTDINSCGTAVASATVTVDAEPSAGTISGPGNVCVGGTSTLTETVPGGAWDRTNARANVAVGGLVTGVTVGLDTISYTFTNTCGSATTTYSIAVITIPTVAAVTGPANVCVGASITLADAAPGGTWAAGNTSASASAGGIITGATAGAVTITYTVGNTCGSVTATKDITVNASPAGCTVTGLNEICPDDLTTLVASYPGGLWSITNGNAFLDATGVLAGLHPGTDTVIYVATNSCGTATVIFPVTILPFSSCHTAGVGTTNAGESSLKVYPNPNGGSFTLFLSSAIDEKVEVTITNILGEKVHSFSIATNKPTGVNLDLAKGIYFISAVSGHDRFLAKMTVE